MSGPALAAKADAILQRVRRHFTTDANYAADQFTYAGPEVVAAAVDLLGDSPHESAIRGVLMDYLAAVAEKDALAQQSPSDPHEAVEKLLRAYLSRRTPLFYGHAAERDRELLAAQPVEVKRLLLRALFQRTEEVPDDAPDRWQVLPPVYTLIRALFDEAVDGWLEESVTLAWVATGTDHVAPVAVADLIRDVAARGELSPPVLAAWRRMLTGGSTDHPRPQPLSPLPQEPLLPYLNVGEAWADQAIADLEAMAEPDRAAWQALLLHTTTATTTRPAANWLKAGRPLLAAVGAEAFTARVVEWLPLVGRPRSIPLRRNLHDHDRRALPDPYNVIALRGLLWLLTCCPADDAVARAVAGLVETALWRVPGVGPRSPRLANTGVYALSKMDGEGALGQLARLASRTTNKSALKEVEKALNARAEALGLPREEIDELAIPAYGLTDVGGRTEKLGDVTVEVRVAGDTATLEWRNAADKVVKSPPASVKRDHAEELSELKASVKDIGKMLSAQRERLDRMILDRRSWRYGQWRERYLDHPLTGSLTRRLIWVVGGTACCWRDGALRDHADAPVTPGDDSTVELWHPIGRDVADVMAWREWLERHEITQPFKQAHREVYLLTDAERTTAVYSNRFAAHIVRQHQFHQLAQVRGWNDHLRLMVDDRYPATSRLVPQWGLRAEYWVTGAGDQFDVDTTETGTFLRLATDQVRFYPIDAPLNQQHASGGRYEMWVDPDQESVDPLSLADIPPLVLSEVMRDIDLFVGVASVGNDPTWSDGGPENRYQEYWHSYSFGELSATAQTRRDLLARLVPRLAIADRCHLDGRFLEVRGDLRTYKIHLGSGNILMKPDDQYLCIVPGSRKTDEPHVRLPFEGDRTLALVLSKAFLLAADTSITDPTIISQIRRRT